LAISYGSAIAFEFGTVSSTVQTLGSLGFTSAQVDQASRLFLTVNSGGLLYRYDGGVPTSTVGLLCNSTIGDGIIELFGHSRIELFEFIRSGTTDATIAVMLDQVP